MGFWHTGYIEFHEPVGLGEAIVPTPPVYRCKHCDEAFGSPYELHTHRFEQHPYSRPVLFIRDIEVGTTPLRITKPLIKDDIQISHCDHAWINGVPLSPSDISDQLVATTNDTVTIKLANEGVSAEFSLRLAIASEDDLDGVDRCFLDVARRGRLDKRSIEDFIRAAEVFSSSTGYVDGICEYFYGVLAKERSVDSSLPYDAYREKFTRADEALKDFDRPLARVIGALIAFHFNRFIDSRDLAGKSRVGIASERFERWIAKDTAGADALLARDFDAGIEKLVTDYESERIIAWCVADSQSLKPHAKDIESLICRDIPEFDRTKLRVLLAELYANHGNRDKAASHARDLRNNPTFGQWAESVLERLTGEGKSHV